MLGSVFRSACSCAAASAAAAVARHDCCGFFFMHKADVSSTGIGFMHLGGVRKPHVFRVVPTMASVYLGQLHVLHPLNTDDDRFAQSALLPPTDHSALTSHHHSHITIRIEHRRDHIHERIIPFCKL